MSLLIFFAIVFATIVFAIVLQRIIHCPILVGFAFFAEFLIVAAIFNSTILVIVAISLGILAFIVAFLDCIFMNSRFFRNNNCLRCRDNDNNNNNDCGCDNRNNIALTSGNLVTSNDEFSNSNCGCRNCRSRR